MTDFASQDRVAIGVGLLAAVTGMAIVSCARRPRPFGVAPVAVTMPQVMPGTHLVVGDNGVVYNNGTLDPVVTASSSALEKRWMLQKNGFPFARGAYSDAVIDAAFQLLLELEALIRANEHDWPARDGFAERQARYAALRADILALSAP